MSSKRIKMDASHYIDVEAVDEDSDTSGGSDSDDGTQFQANHGEFI